MRYFVQIAETRKADLMKSILSISEYAETDENVSTWGCRLCKTNYQFLSLHECKKHFLRKIHRDRVPNQFGVSTEMFIKDLTKTAIRGIQLNNFS